MRARARTLFHPGESRIAYPAAIRRLYIRFSSPLVSPSLLYALVFVTRALFLFVLPGGTIASSSPFSNFSPGSVYRSSSFSPSVSSPVSFFLSFFFSSSSLPLFFLLRRQSPDALLSFFAVSHTRNARALSFSPSCSLPLSSLSVGWRSACLTSRRPTSSPSTADTRLLSPLAARAGHSFRLVRSTPLVFRAHHTAAPSLFLAPE